jgi:hypothetical protein
MGGMGDFSQFHTQQFDLSDLFGGMGGNTRRRFTTGGFGGMDDDMMDGHPIF